MKKEERYEKSGLKKRMILRLRKTYGKKQTPQKTNQQMERMERDDDGRNVMRM